MAADSTFRLFSSSSDGGGGGLTQGFGFGFSESPQTPLPPPPPCVEVHSYEVSTTAKYAIEPVNFGELTLLKGRVSTQEVFALSNFDLVPGKYEGGLKIWEGSIDLVKALQSEIKNGHLSFAGKRVLELGCGHGLPAIFASLEGAVTVHVQDFNAEVLKCLTIPNFNSNLKRSRDSRVDKMDEDVRFFAGDWSEMHRLLPYARDNKSEVNHSLEYESSKTGYDIILMAETVYSISTLQNLYELVKKCLGHPHGVVYMAAKKHYFGVGGGSRRFLSVVEKDGVMVTSLVAEVADGSSNVREVWKLSFK
ncbi:histidine protein methyltransferase 1 homolog [Punica granatum]|uniref:protein-histidine N-methyltransferase n=2 Tax=Punica granatum TaxID=22663 RepID=A0A218XHS1_PUNGR|nr:histidine protein methyltransferase 1 homolog [Punica granatum]OWM84229.1 hypothetical protein CDL15_Pgr011614 [Punica granatum]PKI61134.1 hypothetical protein CRG98_018454 [Punica granatum]